MLQVSPSDDERRYWQSSVSRVEADTVRVRGYDLTELIGGLTFTEATYLLVRGELGTPQQIVVLDAVLNGVLDYALQKSGTVAARYIASANPNMAASLAGAILAIGKNTLAPEDTAQFALDAHRRLVDAGIDLEDRERVDALADEIVAECRAARVRIPGLGHPVFTYEDPRAVKLKAIAQHNGVWGPVGDFYERIHAAFTRLPGKQTIPLNDVGMIALILVELGFTPDETTGVIAMSTLPGVVAHVSEELRSGRPIRVIDPSQVDYEIDERDFSVDRKHAGW
ncbi:citryl-CoA lyase [Microbacterium sp. 2MCAF23]|uniref:citryl-CoA lyase n=1 Tax=Microbacterium sp. 2MCAF23 TaxID=3232985 RepID=UPI003F9B102A